MKFGMNSRKGSSSVIIVMVVVVIALAGTAIYAALDNTMIAKNGYAMPGSTTTYEMKTMNDPSITETVSIFGYTDGGYFIDLDGTMPQLDPFSLRDLPAIGINIPDELIHTENSKVNVPGLGKAVCTITTVNETYGTSSFEYKQVSVLNGLVVEMSMTYVFYGEKTIDTEVVMTDSNIEIGDYSKVSISETLTNSSNDITVTVNAVSSSTDGHYVYEISKVNEESVFYIGDDNMIPVYVETGTNTFKIYSTTINFDSKGITSIYWNGTYVPATN